MSITTRDQLINALANNRTRFQIAKNSIANAAAGQTFSLFRATGQPAQAAIPTAAAICTSALNGAIPFPNQIAPAASYLGLAAFQSPNAGSNIEIHDRIAHMGGLSGTVTTSQGALSLVSLAPPAERIGPANYSELSWWLEIYTDLGSTGVNATVAVEYDDASTGNLATIALGATPRAGRFYPLVPTNGRFIRAVTGVTLSATTGAAGNFGITVTRQRFTGDMPVANKTERYNWADLGISKVENDAFLMLAMTCVTTSTGAVNGSVTLAHG